MYVAQTGILELPRDYPGTAHSACVLIQRGDRRSHFDTLFVQQLPTHVHRTAFFARDYVRVVVQLPRNYPAAAHAACVFI